MKLARIIDTESSCNTYVEMPLSLGLSIHSWANIHSQFCHPMRTWVQFLHAFQAISPAKTFSPEDLSSLITVVTRLINMLGVDTSYMISLSSEEIIVLKGLLCVQFKRIISSAIGGSELLEDLGGPSIADSSMVIGILPIFKQAPKAAARLSCHSLGLYYHLRMKRRESSHQDRFPRPSNFPTLVCSPRRRSGRFILLYLESLG